MNKNGLWKKGLTTAAVAIGDTYTGLPFFSLIDPSDPDILNQYVVTAGTDGYEVLFSLAELDPAYGASAAINVVDLVPYADTGGNFPGDGIARIITPGDTPMRMACGCPIST
jgi:hypothetical protein